MVTHLQPVVIDKQTTLLPVSINVLFDDFVAASEYFAEQLEAESARGGKDLLTRWRETANGLAVPEPSGAMW